jgi:hypothetical protein
MISFGIFYSGSVCFMTGVEIYVDKFKRMFPKLRLKNFANKSIPVDVLVKLINKELEIIALKVNNTSKV